MKAVFFVALVLFATLASTAELDLDESNFDQTIKDNDFVLVMFFAPWCGHCKSLKPKFTEASDLVEGAVLAKVDCTLDEAKDLCARYEVRGYPTVKFFKHGNPTDYTGPRETEGIVSWVAKKSGPLAETLDTADKVKEFLSEDNRLVGFFEEAKGLAHEAFMKAAADAKMEEVKFGQAIGSAAMSGHKEGDIVFHVFGKDMNYPGEGDLAQWAFENSFPLVDEVGGHNFGRYAQLGLPLYLIFIEPTADNHEQFVKGIETVAADHKDEKFSWIDAVKYKAQIKGMGASGDVVPCIIRLSGFSGDNKPIVFEEKLEDATDLRKFVDGVHDGTYKYVPKSEPVPEDNTKPVTVVVGSQFDDIVMDKTKDVLLEVYAPWCGHCKKLIPEYEKLGEAFKDVDSVVIAKLDGTANDFEAGVEVTGFPTILFFSAADKTAQKYQGGRDAESMVAFIKENASSDFDKDSISA